MDSIRSAELKNAKRRNTYKNKRKKNSHLVTKKHSNKGQEQRCVNNFKHLGKSEVETPLGYIDLLTTDYIVEFKIYKNAKDALGQILCYSNFHPRKKKLVVLFGKGLATWKAFSIFERVCALYDVEVFKLSHSSRYKELKIKLGDSTV